MSTPSTCHSHTHWTGDTYKPLPLANCWTLDTNLHDPSYFRAANGIPAQSATHFFSSIFDKSFDPWCAYLFFLTLSLLLAIGHCFSFFSIQALSDYFGRLVQGSTAQQKTNEPDYWVGQDHCFRTWRDTTRHDDGTL